MSTVDGVSSTHPRQHLEKASELLHALEQVLDGTAKSLASQLSSASTRLDRLDRAALEVNKILVKATQTE